MDLTFEFPNSLDGKSYEIILPIHDGTGVVINWNNEEIKTYNNVKLGDVKYTFTNIIPNTSYNVKITAGTFTEFGVASEVDASFNYF